MQKIIPLIFLASFPGLTLTAMAATGEAQFLGVVTSGTCDIHTEVNSVRTNIVNFGTVPAGGTASTDMVRVSFSFKPDMSSPACTGLTVSDRVSISWNTGGFVQVPVADSPDTPYKGVYGTGKASEAFVILHDDTYGPDGYVGGDRFTFDWERSLQLEGAVSYTAYFYPGTVPGDYHSAAAWVVSYA